MKRNIFGMMLVMFCVLAITPAVFAQTTIKLFDPVYLNTGAAASFRTTTVYLSCSTAQIGTLSGANGGSLIVDDFFTVNETNVCLTGSCFSDSGGASGFYAANDYPGLYPIETYYTGVSPLQIQLAAGTNPYTFNLVNGGGEYGSTEINLTTNCSQIYPICHRNNGVNGQNTIYVDSQNAVNVHLRHGDTAGVCRTGTPQ
ncbi:MAG: hypothetical protein M3388_04530 [Acidobacteriota bacterium]|nr:hypothetical protein [Acidobacteriota bacterium]